MAITDDPAVYLDYFGKPVSWAPPAGPAVEKRGIPDLGGGQVLGADGRAPVSGGRPTVLIPTADVRAGGLALDMAITVDGAPYTVADIKPVDDGAWSRVDLLAG